MRTKQRLAATLWLLHACALPPHVRPARPSPHWAARCSASGPRQVACSARVAREVLLPFRVHQLAARHSGGAYALGGDGQLARFDAAGRLTGVFETRLTSLVATIDYVCGLEHSGRVVCARDHHQDLSCSGAELPPWREAGLPRWPEAQLHSAQSGAALCLTAEGKRVCVPGRSFCDSGCLAFPACAPLRCVDPCPEGDGS